jgi:hypothetical protein
MSLFAAEAVSGGAPDLLDHGSIFNVTIDTLPRIDPHAQGLDFSTEQRDAMYDCRQDGSYVQGGDVIKIIRMPLSIVEPGRAHMHGLQLHV